MSIAISGQTVREVKELASMHVKAPQIQAFELIKGNPKTRMITYEVGKLTHSFNLLN